MDLFERIRQQNEREMMEKEIARLSGGPPSAPVELFFRGEAKPWLRMARADAVKHIQLEWTEGVRHRLRTKDAIRAFLDQHGIQYELVDHSAEAYSRVGAEIHKRMRAATLNRRRHMPVCGMARRAYL